MSTESLRRYSVAVEDPRCSGKIEYRLTEVLVVAVCTIVACAKSWNTASRCMAASRAGLVQDVFGSVKRRPPPPA